MGTNAEIVETVLPSVVARFLQKGQDYQGAHDHLGLPGQFSDINRKFWKLRRAMWEGAELTDEDLEEVLGDMIGHCLLSIAMLREGNHGPEAVGLGRYVGDRSSDGGPTSELREVRGDPPHGQ